MRRPGFIQIMYGPEGEGGGGGAASSSPSTPSSVGGSSSAPSGTPSPAATPSTPAASSPTAASGPLPAEGAAGDQSGFDFNTILGDLGGGDVVELPVATAPVAPSTAPAPQAPVVAPVATPPAAPAAASVAPTQQPQAPAASNSGTGQRDASPPLSPAEPGRIAAALEQNRAAILDHVADTLFKLSPEDVEALETNVVGTIPKLLARSYVAAQHAMLTQLQNSVPPMLQNMISSMRVNSQNEGKFFSRWPDLKASEHGDLVRRLAVTYRQMNPTASLEQMVEDLGPMAMMVAKVTPRPVAAPGQPVAPAVAPNGARMPPPSPFVPAMGGAVASTEQPEGNPWDILGHQGE
jgi:hypothetical protein